MELYKKAVI